MIKEERNYIGLVIYILGLMLLSYGAENHSVNLSLSIILGIFGIVLISTGCVFNKERNFMLGFFLVCGLIISIMYIYLIYCEILQ